MQFFKISTIIFIALLVVACGKQEPMYNNPKGIVIYKDGESLTDLAKRIMGTKVDSLGIALDQDRSTYESKPFLITGTFNQPGHPIFDVQLSGCNLNKKIALGSLFGDFGCNKESLIKLKNLAADSNSDIKQMCAPVDVDESQEVLAYADTKKEIYWGTTPSEIYAAGVYRGSIALGEFGVLQCDEVAREKYKANAAKRAQDAKWRYGLPGAFIVKGKEYTFEDVKVEGNSMLDKQGNDMVTAYAYITSTELPNDPFSSIQTHISGGEIRGTSVYTDTNNWVNFVVNPQNLIGKNFTQEDYKEMKRSISRAQGNKALVRIEGRFGLFRNTYELYFAAQTIEIVGLKRDR